MPSATGPDALVIHDNETNTTKYITVTSFFSLMYPVGSVYTNATNNANPATIFGFGTWESVGAGRVLVGVDTTQSEFNTVAKTGGAKTVSLTGDQNGSHSHGVYDPGHSHGFYWSGSNSEVVTNARDIEWSHAVDAFYRSTEVSGTNIGIYSSGSGAPHNNLQPYLTVYMWKRTA